MAPNGEIMLTKFQGGGGKKKLQSPSVEGLQRAMSDLSLELKREGMIDVCKLQPISEVEVASCECCGMSEECTKAYIRLVREKFVGRWICGLCSEAVKEEMKKVGGMEEALQAHMNTCATFNRIRRTQPVLYQAEAMRRMLRKRSSRHKQLPDAADMAAGKKKGGIMRTSSCLTTMTKGASGLFSDS